MRDPILWREIADKKKPDQVDKQKVIADSESEKGEKDGSDKVFEPEE